MAGWQIETKVQELEAAGDFDAAAKLIQSFFQVSIPPPTDWVGGVRERARERGERERERRKKQVTSPSSLPHNLMIGNRIRIANHHFDLNLPARHAITPSWCCQPWLTLATGVPRSFARQCPRPAFVPTLGSGGCCLFVVIFISSRQAL